MGILKPNLVRDVRALLEQKPETRDDDKKLMANLWAMMVGIDNMKVNSGLWLLRQYVNGDLPNPDSITRCRRKLQEEFPHLRGERYLERQAKLEPEVRNEMKGLGL